jgi:hypothetical protein
MNESSALQECVCPKEDDDTLYSIFVAKYSIVLFESSVFTLTTHEWCVFPLGGILMRLTVKHGAAWCRALSVTPEPRLHLGITGKAMP